MSGVAERTVLTYLRMALASVLLALVFGAVAVLHYIPAASDVLNGLGLGLTRFRPLHTTFVHAWIFGACMAMIHAYLHREHGAPDAADAARTRFATTCFLVAGGAALISLMAGVTSGREYLGFHPLISAIFLAGWLAFAWTALKYLRRGFFSRPIYVWQWTIGILFFIYTFLEGHAHLLPSVNSHPLVDLQIQWKSCGTLVGSFNFMVYGCLLWLGERLSGDPRYAQSKTCFALFAIGCINSFTNFAHHSYHLPQSHAVKWIAFVMSMLEIIIVVRVLTDVVKAAAARVRPGYDATQGFLVSARWWTWIMVASSVLISIPSLNAIIHGTHVVLGHAMGTELGIDTMVLLAGVTFLLRQMHADCPRLQAVLGGWHVRGTTIVLNVATALLAGWLTLSGTFHGWARYNGQADPAWISSFGWLFPFAGFLLAASLVSLLAACMPLLSHVASRRAEAARAAETASVAP